MLPQVYIGYFGKGRHGDTKQDTGPTLGLSARAAHSCSLTSSRRGGARERGSAWGAGAGGSARSAQESKEREGKTRGVV